MEIKCTAQRCGQLSSFLQKELKMSSGLINRLKWQAALLVNGKPEYTNFPVQIGDTITVILDDAQPEYPAETGDLRILYEDAHLLAVDKPAGMLIHPSRNRNTGTLANYVAGYYQSTGQHSAFHPLTRLDRDTFGIVLLAKNAHIHRLLQTSRPQKTYQALVFGTDVPEQGTIDAPIARCPLPSLLREIRPDGKPSITAYQKLCQHPEYALMELLPITGRTHQLRLHCLHMGFPILGDPQYRTPESHAYSSALGLETQLLCAKQLMLTHPMTGTQLILESKMSPVIPHKNSENPY